MKRTQTRKAVAATALDAASPSSPDALARAALRRLRRGGDTVPETTTPERLLRAGGTARVETFNRSVEVHRGGRVETETVPAQRMRIDDGPLARLQARGLLAVGPDAATRNAFAAAAAERYRLTWFAAGLQPLRSPDISLERVSGGQGGLLRTDRQVANFHAHGRAVAAMPSDVRRVVDAVVLHEREPADIGRDMSGYRQDKQATAVALYLLRTGLAALAVHYGLVRAAMPR